MEWITQLKGKVVGLDTAPLVYFIEENLLYLDMEASFFLTNDAHLPSLPELKVLVLDQLRGEIQR